MAKIEYIKDIAGSNYLGINIYPDMVYPYLQKMKDILGDEYDEYVKYQQDRDRNHYHCTVLNVIELNSIISKNLADVNLINQVITGLEITDFKMLGLGAAERNGNKSFFVVCQSKQLSEFREKVNKPFYDFHITLGFKHKDVFGIRKTEILPDIDLFLKTLKQYFIDLGESFDFLKELPNYEYDLSKEIFCTKINNNYAEFRVGNESGVSDYFTVSLINNKLTISCMWQDSVDIPYLATTLILRKLKK